MKRYINSALVYIILALVFGVFYREFTKFMGYTGETTLAVVHVHYLALGVLLSLLLLLMEKNFSFTGAKTNGVLVLYHTGLNLTAVMFVVRGIVQVIGKDIPSGMNAAISGIAGIGHILLGVSLVVLVLQIRRGVLNANSEK